MNLRVARKINRNLADYRYSEKKIDDAWKYYTNHNSQVYNKCYKLLNRVTAFMKNNSIKSSVSFFFNEWQMLKKLVDKSMKKDTTIDGDYHSHGKAVATAAIDAWDDNVEKSFEEILLDLRYYADRWCSWRFVAFNEKVSTLNTKVLMLDGN